NSRLVSPASLLPSWFATVTSSGDVAAVVGLRQSSSHPRHYHYRGRSPVKATWPCPARVHHDDGRGHHGPGGVLGPAAAQQAEKGEASRDGPEHGTSRAMTAAARVRSVRGASPESFRALRSGDTVTTQS